MPSNEAVTVVSPRMGTNGWPFANVDEFPGADVDPLYDSEHVRDLYLKADPDYGGRFETQSAIPSITPQAVFDLTNDWFV